MKRGHGEGGEAYEGTRRLTLAAMMKSFRVAADKILARGNDSVFSTHLNAKKIPVTSRLERRSSR